jgi:hypothetical protein
MDTKDLELLEFPRIREIIAGYCSFSMGRDMAMSLSPSTDIDEINKRLEESKEAGKTNQETAPLPPAESRKYPRLCCCRFTRPNPRPQNAKDNLYLVADDAPAAE